MIEIKLTPARDNWLEATWTEVTQEPDVVTPAVPDQITPITYDVLDAEGNVVTPGQPEQIIPGTPETTTPGQITRTEVKHTSYHPTQLDLLQADALAMGTDLTEHEPMLLDWESSYVPEPEPVLTVSDFDAALTQHIDSVAQARQYDNRITCMVRAGFQGPYQKEAKAFAAWADGCNLKAYKLLQDVLAGKAPMPATTADFLDQLPAMVWP